MRIRRKSWARPELAAAPFAVDRPADWRGRWRSQYPNPQAPLVLELGCGKGRFLAQMAFLHPEQNFLAVDLKSEVLGLAKRSAEKVFGDRPIENLRLAAQNVEWIDEMLSPEDRIEHLYINFCNPWSKPRDHKHRLTHPRQLVKYRQFLVPGCPVELKTDDEGLFLATRDYFTQCGYQIEQCEVPLPESHPACAIMTEHEQMFRAMGLPIHYIRALAPDRED